MFHIFMEWCTVLSCSEADLAGFFIHLAYSKKNHKLANVGWALFSRNPYPVVHEVSPVEAIWIIERMKISAARYLELQKRLEKRIIFPTYIQYHKEMLTMRPTTVTHLHHGVTVSMKEMLTLTLKEILMVIKDKGGVVPLNIAFEFCWGMDGSGNHKDWNQMSKRAYSTKDMFLVVFSLVKVWDEFDEKHLLWTPTKGHNSPTNVRPLAIIPAQETDELLDEVVPLYESEVEEMQEAEFRLIIELPGQLIKARMNFQQISMIDGKMIFRISGQAGAYCFNCHFTKEQCHDLLLINSEEIFYVTKSLEEMHEIAERLTDPRTGKIKKKTGDSEERGGQVHRPKVRHLPVNLVLPATHLKINVVTYIFENFLPKQNSHQNSHTVTNKGKYTEAEKDHFKEARQELRDFVHEAVGIAFGGSSNRDKQSRGGWFHKFAGDDVREKVVQQLKDPVDQQDKQLQFSEFLLRLFAIIKVINSQHHEVNVPKFFKVCKEAYVLFVKTFPWARMTGTIHRGLAHSWEFIEANGGYGLGGICEEGGEHCNKIIRYLKDHGARCTSTEDSCEDIINHVSNNFLIHTFEYKEQDSYYIILIVFFYSSSR